MLQHPESIDVWYTSCKIVTLKPEWCLLGFCLKVDVADGNSCPNFIKDHASSAENFEVHNFFSYDYYYFKYFYTGTYTLFCLFYFCLSFPPSSFILGG